MPTLLRISNGDVFCFLCFIVLCATVSELVRGGEERIKVCHMSIYFSVAVLPVLDDVPFQMVERGRVTYPAALLAADDAASATLFQG